jgi:hypothetical protein
MASRGVRIAGALVVGLVGGVSAYAGIAASLPDSPTAGRQVLTLVAAAGAAVCCYLTAIAGGYAIRLSRPFRAPGMTPSLDDPALDRARRDLLDQVRRHWVETELAQSLYQLARIEIGLVERPMAVENPVRATLRRPSMPDRDIERGTPIVRVYEDLGRQLLILGSPGAGKTTLLLELTRDLLAQAERDLASTPMPVVFHLSSWAQEQASLEDWLADELQRRYGVAPSLARGWVYANRVIPLLDGLDEVADRHRDQCVDEINRFHGEHGQLPLVVCCRVEEYKALQTRLCLRGAIAIQALTPADVTRYVRQLGRHLAGVRAVLRDDDQLVNLMTTPLFLGVVVLTYGGKPASAIRMLGTLDERRRRVLGDYVVAMLDRPTSASAPSPPPRDQTMRWLTWLARSMQAHNQSIFYIDWIQTTWLPTRAQQRLVVLGVSAAVGVATGLLAAADAVATFSWFSTPQVAVSAGLLLGWIAAFVGGLAAYGTDISPTETLHWSVQAARRHLRSVVSFGLTTGLIIGVAAGVVAGLRAGPIAVVVGMLTGAIGGQVVGLFLALVGGLEAKLSVTPVAPAQGMRTSRRSALMSALAVGPGSGVVAAIGIWIVLHLGLWVGHLGGEVGVGLGAGVVSGFVAGLSASYVIQFGGPFSMDWGIRRRITIGLGIAIGAGVAGGFLAVPVPPTIGAAIAGAGIGLGVATVVALQCGGGAYLRHWALRALLVRNQDIPPRYVAFLEYAARCVLLKRRGGGYQFLHRLLLDYFADPQSAETVRAFEVGPAAICLPAGPTAGIPAEEESRSVR